MTFSILSDIESVRKNPGMFIGSTNDPTHLITEVVDNALDELLNNYGDTVRLDIDKNGVVSIQDNGRGLITGDYESDGVTKDIPVWICTKLFSGEKFSKDAYVKSSGLHGVGNVCVNALSEYMEFFIKHKNQKTVHYFKFKDGESSESNRYYDDSIQEGTLVKFKPDSKWFDSGRIDIESITKKLRLVKLFHPNLKIIINGEEIKDVHVSEFFRTKSDSQFTDVIHIDLDSVRVYLTYDLRDTSTNIAGSVNLINTTGGSHYRAFQEAISEVWNSFKGSYEFQDSDTLLGINAVFLIYLEHTAFTSQTKKELSVRVNQIRPIFDKFKKLLRKEIEARYDTLAKPLLEKFQTYRKSMTRLSTIDFIKKTIQYGDISSGRVSRSTTVKKLYDCSSTKVDETELFLVEGQSAGGSILSCRDPKRHALLPLRGKTLNVTNSDLETILKNQEFQSLVNSLGSGVYPHEDPSKVRYGKIIILTDADQDGSQIAALLLGAFAKLTPGLIDAGHLHICIPPLFRQGGKYYWDINEIDKRKEFFRFKGLGEMNPEELYEVAVNPKTRKVLQVTGSVIDKSNTISMVGDSFYRKGVLIENGVLSSS